MGDYMVENTGEYTGETTGEFTAENTGRNKGKYTRVKFLCAWLNHTGYFADFFVIALMHRQRSMNC